MDSRSHSSDNQPNPDATRAGKRAQFTDAGGDEQPQAGNTAKILVILTAALVGVASFMLAYGTDDGQPATALSATRTARASDRPAGDSATAGEDVVIRVSELSGKARFYEYRAASGETVRFFAMRSSDGVYRAALDSCDVCFAARQGYRQEGDDMVCNKCGNHFQSAEINEASGGCNPVGLKRKVEGNRLVIKAAELERGASYF